MSRSSSGRSVLLVVAIGTLLGAMTGTMISTGLPALGRDLGVGLEQANMVLLIYFLISTVMMLLAGRVGDFIGYSRVYIVGFGFFGLTSLLCGLAVNLETLVVARGLQGLAGAMVMAAGPALLVSSFPGSQRGRVLGLVSTATYVGLTLGPPMGGLLVQFFGWRWIFLFGVPISAVVSILGARFLAPTPIKRGWRTDWAGLGLMLCGLLLILIPLSAGHRLGWPWQAVVVSSLLGLGILGLFLKVESQISNPLLDPRLFRSRTLVGATLAAVFNYIALFMVLVMMPYYFDEGLGLAPGVYGPFLSSQAIVMALVASPMGRLSDRFGTRGLGVTGMLIMALGVGLLALVSRDTPIWMVCASLGVVGLGTGTFISPNSSALMGSAPRELQGSASGLLASARNLGMMLGITAATAIFLVFGGRTGEAWEETDFTALSITLGAAAGFALLAALASALRGGRREVSGG